MKVSIITVCWNSEKYIGTTIKSVLEQTYQNIEYILVDGGSEDGTVNIIKEYCPLFNGRMKWISERDLGLYDAMNKGVRMAAGDVVGIINSDDFFSNNTIVEQIVEAFSDKSIDAVYGDVRFVQPKCLNKTVRYYSSKIFRPYLFRFGFMPAHPSFYVKRVYYEKFGLYKTDYKIAADYELLIRFLYKNGLKTKYLSKDFVTMRIGGVSTESFRSRYVLNKEIVRGCKENGVWTHISLLSLKYFIKIFELLFTKNV